MYDIIIVGAGPAGLTSAIFATRADKKVLVLEASTYGGQIINTHDIDNYPAAAHISGYDFATNLYNQALDLGAEIKFEKVIDIEDNSTKKRVVTIENQYECSSIIIATGADNRKLGIPMEDELLGKGISYCATCDGAFYKEKVVAVQGGGNVALEDAIYLSNIASKVYLIHRRDEFRADETLVNKIKSINNIELILNSNVISLNGENNLESIDVRNKDGKITRLDVSALFIAIGRIPENQNFAKLINLNEFGYIVSDENCHTNVDGIFVAGDNRTKKLRQLVTATSDGAVAASEAIKYINRKK